MEPACELLRVLFHGDLHKAEKVLQVKESYQDDDGLSIFLLARHYLDYLTNHSQSFGCGLSNAWTTEQIQENSCRTKVFTLLKSLFRLGVPINTQHNGETPLFCAVSTHDRDLIKLMLENGADPNVKTKDNDINAIALAIILNDAEILKLLISHGAKVNETCCQKLTPLQLSMNKSVNVSKALLQNGADVQQVMQMNGRNDVYITSPPLIHAVETNNMFLARILLEHGEDINQGYGSCSNSPLHIAILQHNTDMVKLLIQFGVNLNKRNGRGNTPLAQVLLHCKGPVLKMLAETLISAGCSFTKGSPIEVFRRHYPPLHIAAFYGTQFHLEVIQLMIEKAEILEKDWEMEHLEMLEDISARERRLPTSKPGLSSSERTSDLLIRGRQVFINTQAIDKSTALYMSVLGDNLNVAKYLVDHGADPYISCQNGSLLHAAVMASKTGIAMMKFALQFQFDLNMLNEDGNTCLILAARNSSVSVCRLVIEHGALLNIQDSKFGETALSASVYFGFEENAELLISSGADPDIPDFRDTDALYWAIFNCREQSLRMLLDAGARLTRKDLDTYPKNIKVMRNLALKSLLQNYVEQPRGLQHCCRHAIRRHLMQVHAGKSIMAAMMSLPLPAKLKSYLSLAK